MKHFFLPYIVFSLILAASFAYGADQKLRQFAMYATPTMKAIECGLAERRSHPNDPVVKFDGHIVRKECQVSIKKEKYEHLFRFCFMSGVSLYKASGDNSFECFVQERAEDYFFLASISKESGESSQVMCYFTCVVNQ